MDLEPIAFHEVHGTNVRLSEGEKVSQMTSRVSESLCFTDRPVAPGEKVVLTDVSRDSFNIVRFGFTKKDPSCINHPEEAHSQHPRSDERFWECIFGNAVFQTEIVVYNEEATGYVISEADGSTRRMFDAGFEKKTAMYLVLYHWGDSKIQISSRKDLRVRTAPGDPFYPEKSRTFQDFVLEPAHFIAPPATSDVKVRANFAVNHNSQPSKKDFAFIDSRLRAGSALVVELTALKRTQPVQIVLTNKDAHRVYSCSALSELCKSTYSLTLESGPPIAGGEIAVRISPSGAVYVSDKGRWLIQGTRVDVDLTYRVVIDMQHVSVVSIIGVAFGLSDIDVDGAVDPKALGVQWRNTTLSVVPVECVICLQNTRDAVVIPCYHVALCLPCTVIILASTNRKCPICRKNITDSKKLYYA